MASDERESLRLLADNLLGELSDLERQCHDEGGFLTSDPRAARMLELGKQYDDVELQLFEIELLNV